LKLVDLGMWHDLTCGLVVDRPYRGSPAYMAPEVFANVQGGIRALVPYEGTSADAWSLAVCLFVMVCGFYPLSEQPRAWHYQHLARKQTQGISATTAICGDDFVHGEYAEPIRSRLPQSLTHVLDVMLMVMPSERATLRAVRQSEFVMAQCSHSHSSSDKDGPAVCINDATPRKVCPYCGSTQIEGAQTETVCSRCGIVVAEGEPADGAFYESEPWFDNYDADPVPQLRGQPLQDCDTIPALAAVEPQFDPAAKHGYSPCYFDEPDDFVEPPSYRNTSSNPLPTSELNVRPCNSAPLTSVVALHQASPLRRQYNCRHYDVEGTWMSESTALVAFLLSQRKMRSDTVVLDEPSFL